MPALHVLFKVADAEYALSAAQVLHMESFTGVTRVPGTLPYVAGLAQIRSRVVPVIDLRLRFGAAAIEPTLDSRIMVVAWRERSVGLLADSARDVMYIDTATFRPPPDVIAQQAAGFVASVAQVGDRLIMLMDIHNVICEEVLHGDH